MQKQKKHINLGGVNGTGKGIVDTNSKDYKALQKAILAHYEQSSPEEKIKNNLVSLRFQMDTYLTTTTPKTIISSGEFLKQHINALGINNKAFADYINIKASNLSAILKGKRKISIDLAYKLGKAFDINPNIWIFIQNKNELLNIHKTQKENYQHYKLADLLKICI